MRRERILLTVAIGVVMIAIFVAGFTFYSISSLSSKISGLATGEANLTVETLAVINFTTNSLDWGSGRVDSGQSSAYLDTLEGTVVNGNWTAVSTALIIENIGNVNVTLNISGSGLNASEFIGGTNPAYLWNVSADEAGSCVNATDSLETGMPLNEYYSINTTPNALFCERFRFGTAHDTVRIEFNLTVPDDSLTGTLSDTITATAVSLA